KWDNFKGLAGGEIAGRGWIKSVNNARRRINTLFKNYPSLRLKLPHELQKAWDFALDNLIEWLEDNDYDPEDFHIPQECPYTYEEAMTRDLKKEPKS
ncbi:MAG: DUF29 domain-containing protein, partial [Hydrogenobacter thermophilus]|nr:DUF29 domain-containing protein [Hydrogenobacter thermophilus]